ncbi:Cysteine and histidine-rich domain-containing protein [Hypsizygus marmoreus]|uniref:Cysteine and histidine-rich domain-containing protein n=1 Tax=Hypsizygus marmoreus TaxID=39966 RepID=A0A369JK61_HYPMA|nr:Cysteine and histidine-rich domain-containing protein [Hypsizygus marmoreus]
MMPLLVNLNDSKEQRANFQAAIARTLARSLALYFSRPVRLFRPSKVSGWHSLRGLAAQQGTLLTPQYVLGLVKNQGFIVIPKHFIPPMLVNAMLGTILWTTYAEAFDIIEPNLRNHPTLCAGLAGGVAGGAQALAAAPAENVRILLEGGSGGSSWSKAWQEVFRGTRSASVSKQKDLEEIRRLRGWMREVGDMAGRGWDGWGWGLGKDICGFAAFFSIFEVTRRVALQYKSMSQHPLTTSDETVDQGRGVKHQLSRVVHGLTLITGGVIAGLAYETISRPWDVARRVVQLDRITHPPSQQSQVANLILQKACNDGILSFFRSPDNSGHRETTDHHSKIRARVHSVLRTLGRHKSDMPRCTRKGCGQEFEKDSTESCVHHTGAPVFHEGLKSWSCCSDINKPVLDFDEFIKIRGCTEAERHSDETPKVDAPNPSSATIFALSDSSSSKEVYSSSERLTTRSASPAPTPAPAIEEEDDLNVTVNPGTLCRRNGCKTAFVSDDVNRKGDGEGTICTYHPSSPIFREGSKGYLCCKRRVLEFDEFLKIPGCKTGRHVFSPSVKSATTEEMTSCRIDHYQTVDKVHVSIFAKQVDKERSTIKFDESRVNIDIYLPGLKRFSRVLELFGPINPEQSSFQYFGTKVELHLQKQDTRSWTVLEKTNQDLGNISLTFGVGGRTGTVGGKDIVLDEVNKARAG